MGRGLLLGLFLGLVVGWTVGGLLRRGAPTEERAAPPLPSARTDEADGSASPAALAGRSPPGEPPASAGSVDVGALRRRLSATAHPAAWGERRAALEALGRADTPEADRLLVELLGDEHVRFEGPLGFHVPAVARGE